MWSKLESEPTSDIASKFNCYNLGSEYHSFEADCKLTSAIKGEAALFERALSSSKYCRPSSVDNE